MQRRWLIGFTVLRIAAEEPSGGRVVISGAQIIQALIQVDLFAAVEVVVGRCALLGEAVTVGVVLVFVGHYASRVSELAGAAPAVIDVEARRPDVASGDSWA